MSFPSGLALGDAHIRLSSPNSLRLTGLTGGDPSRLAVLTNDASAGEALMILEHSAPDADAADRFAFPDALPRFLMPGDSIALLYDAQASAWSEFASQRLAQGFDVFAEAFALNELALLVSGDGAGAVSGDYLLNDSVQKPRGILRLGTGTSAAGRAHWGSGGMAMAAGQGACLYLARLAVETLSSGTERFRIIAGWHDGMETAQASNGVFWDYEEQASPYWRLCAADGGVLATALSNRLVGADYVWLGIFLDAAWNRADFFSSADGRSWTFHDSLISGLPSAVRTLGFSAGVAKSSGEAARHLNVDLQAVRCDGLRGS